MVESNLEKSALSLKYKEGVDPLGNDINRVKKFSNIKIAAADQNIYDVAAAFSTLMKYTVTEIVRTDENVLIDL